MFNQTRKHLDDAVECALKDYEQSPGGETLYRRWAKNPCALNKLSGSGFQHKYIRDTFPVRAMDTYLALSKIDDPSFASLLEHMRRSEARAVRVFDLAGGPGCGAFGVGAFLAERNISFCGIVSHALDWESACRALGFTFKERLANETLASIAQQCAAANVVVLSHVTHIEFVGAGSSAFFAELIDAVRCEAGEKPVLVLWLDEHASASSSGMRHGACLLGKRRRTRMLVWTHECRLASGTRCVVGWITEFETPRERKSNHSVETPRERKSDHGVETEPERKSNHSVETEPERKSGHGVETEPERKSGHGVTYPVCPYAPVASWGVFFVAESTAQGRYKKGKFHADRHCGGLLTAHCTVPVDAAWVTRQKLAPCLVCHAWRDDRGVKVEYGSFQVVEKNMVGAILKRAEDVRGERAERAEDVRGEHPEDATVAAGAVAEDKKSVAMRHGVRPRRGHSRSSATSKPSAITDVSEPSEESYMRLPTIIL